MTARTSHGHVEMEVAGVRRLRRGEHEYHVLTLTEVGGNRYLPLWIGPSEATSIALRLENARGLRPTTAALAAGLLLAAGGGLREVRIERLDENVLYAVAVVDGASGVREVDARPSDAINVALLTGSPITVSEPVLATVWAKMAAETVRPSFDEVAGAADIAAEAAARASARHKARLPPELRTDG